MIDKTHTTQTPTPTIRQYDTHQNTLHIIYIHNTHTPQNTHTNPIPTTHIPHQAHKYPTPYKLSTNYTYTHNRSQTHPHTYSQTDTLTPSQGTKEKALGKKVAV